MAADDLAAMGLHDPEEIGRGGFGVVYRCVQRTLERVVAVKVLSAEIDDDARERFLREEQAMGRLSGHPNIVDILEVGVTPTGLPFIVMPYAVHGSLERLVHDSGPLSWADALRVGVRLAGAIESAHRVQVLHRDVKPANVLLSRYGEPQLTDFGIARIPGGFRTSAELISGSPAFTAPEILAGDEPTVLSDVYGLGSTLFALITGHAAYERQSGEKIVAQFLRIASEPLPDLRRLDIPADVADAVEQAMAHDPAQRPASAFEFGELLRAVQRRHGQMPDEMALLAPEPAPAADGLSKDEATQHFSATIASGPRRSAPLNPATPDRSPHVTPRPATSSNTGSPDGGPLPRPQTLATLRAAGDRKVTLIHGPAGSGKTTVAAQWAAELAERGAAVSWLNVDRDDDQEVWFLSHLVAAIHRTCPDVGAGLDRMLEERAGEAVPYAVAALIDEIAAAARPVVVVIDDWHRITDAATHRVLATLLDSDAPHLRFVVVTRDRSGLPSSRLRTRDEPAEIGPDRLRFTAAETAWMLRQHFGFPLTDAQVRRIHTVTGGSPSTTQLLGLTLRATIHSRDGAGHDESGAVDTGGPSVDDRSDAAHPGDNSVDISDAVDSCDAVDSRADAVDTGDGDAYLHRGTAHDGGHVARTGGADAAGDRGARIRGGVVDAGAWDGHGPDGAVDNRGQAVGNRADVVDNLLAGLPGDDPAVREYLAEHLFGALEPRLLDVLSVVAVTERVCGALVTAMSGEPEAERLLEQAERRELFVGRIADEPGWYRMRPLCAERIRERLERERPEHSKMLHREAARWFADHRQPRRSVEHALAVADSTLALDLLERNGMDLVDAAQLATLQGCVAKLPVQQIGSRTELLLTLARANLGLQQSGATRTALGRVSTLLARRPADDPEAMRQRCQVTVLAAADEVARDRTSGVLERISDCLARADELPAWTVSMAAGLVSFVRWCEFDFDGAREIQQWAAPYHDRSEDPLGPVFGLLSTGIAAYEQLDLATATDCFERAWVVARERCGPRSHAMRVAAALLGGIVYRGGDPSTAERLLEGGHEPVAGVGTVDFGIAAFVTGARVRAVHGNVAGAVERLGEGLRIAADRRLPRLAAVLRAEWLRLAAGGDAAGDATIPQAMWAVSTAVPSPRPLRHVGGVATLAAEAEEVAAIRALLARHYRGVEAPGDAAPLGTDDSAVKRARALHGRVRDQHRPRAELDASLLLAECLATAGWTGEALAVLTPAVLRCVELGWPRPLLDAGPGVRSLLHTLRSQLLLGAAEIELSETALQFLDGLL
ncbi:protein kinase domain-containing protein [Nocardia sp. alder85J]|uniref:protein kinase domain-containing protein n=1 Tax=Nocardia sp. alder85J TaxID=2862949 RepID=UPI002B1CC0F2|nr:protein kinase [Nocardia sp. alder85J]